MTNYISHQIVARQIAVTGTKFVVFAQKLNIYILALKFSMPPPSNAERVNKLFLILNRGVSLIKGQYLKSVNYAIIRVNVVLRRTV